MKLQTLVVVISALALLAGCGGSGSGDAGEDTSGSSGALTDAQERKLRGYVQEDLDKHGEAIGCAWLVSVFGNATVDKAIELAGVEGEWASYWATGTIGNLDGKGETQFATLYHAGGGPHADLRRSEGDAFGCFVSE